MIAVSWVGRSGLCNRDKGRAVPYLECGCGCQHVLAPEVEGRLLAGWATLHPKPSRPPVPFWVWSPERFGVSA